MKQAFLLLGLIVGLTQFSIAQKFFTKSGSIGFDATAPGSPEDIKADNRTVTCVIDGASGAIQFKAAMKAFTFDRALMQEHFNENYVESDKYPEAKFAGNITNISTVSFTKDGSYPVTVKGKLNLHGIEQPVETNAKITIAKGKITATAAFSLVLSDYKVDVPTLVADKVSKTAKIVVNCGLEPLK